MSRTLSLLVATALLACEPVAELRRPTPTPVDTALWQVALTADQSGALVDPAQPARRYPNPLRCLGLEAALTRDGTLCGRCERGDRDVEACGGPERGLPFLLQAQVEGDGLTLDLYDLYGEHLGHFARVAGACAEVTTGEGRRCRLCADAQGRLASTACGDQGEGPADHDPNVDGDGEEDRPPETQEPTVVESSEEDQPRDDGSQDPDVVEYSEEDQPRDDVSQDPSVVEYSEEDQPRDDGAPTTDGDSEEDTPGDDATDAGDDEAPVPVTPPQAGAEDCYREAVEHFLAQLDGTLAALGLPASGLTTDDVQPAATSAELGRRTCAGELHWFETGGEYLTEAGLRCLGLGTDVADDTCAATPARCASQITAYETGVGAAYTTWVQAASKPRDPSLDDDGTPGVDPGLPVCEGSPLVVELEPGELALSSLEQGVRFDLLGSGRPVRTGWVRGGALLAIDLDGDGRIGGGQELFGEASRLPDGRLARDGFAALAAHDDDGNGRIDAGDAVFARLLLWRDVDHDGVSQRDELQPAAQVLTAVSLRATRATGLGARSAGHDVALQAAAARVDGGTATVYDVWFRFASTLVPAI